MTFGRTKLFGVTVTIERARCPLSTRLRQRQADDYGVIPGEVLRTGEPSPDVGGTSSSASY